jgi:hypothetical protein
LDVAVEATHAFEHYFFNFSTEFHQIMERNKNVMVPMKGSYGGVNYLENDFFPFDPFRLRQSQQFILPLYQKWEGSVVNRRRSSISNAVHSPRDQNEFLDDQFDIDYVYNETVGRGRANSINDRAKMFYPASLNTPIKISTSLSSASTRPGSSLMEDDILSDEDEDDQDVDFDDDEDEDISSSDEGEQHYDEERRDENMFARAVAIRDGSVRRKKITSAARSVEEETNLFIEIPIPYGWEYNVEDMGLVTSVNKGPGTKGGTRK